MDINVTTHGEIELVEVAGEIDARTAPTLQQQILSMIQPGSKTLLDMSGVTFMSSAGLRVLLATYRKASSSKGRIVLVALSDDIRDTMSMTGFLRFFAVCPTVKEGLAALE